MERRTLLKLGGASLAVGGMSGLSGCMSASGQSPPPTVPETKLTQNGWVEEEATVDEVFNEDYGPVTVSATAHTLVYADHQLAQELQEQTLGEFGTPAKMFFASRITFDPDLDDLPVDMGQEEINNKIWTHADQSLRTRMQNRGLENVEEIDTKELDIETGETVTAKEYRGTFAYDSYSYSIKDKTITIPGGNLEVTGWLAVWNHNGDSFVAGGVHPAENLAISEEQQLTEAATITFELDLGLTPTEYEDEILGYMKAVN